MNRTTWIATGVLALLIGLGVTWFLMTFHQVPEEHRLPPRGEAAYNPLYALRATLRAHGEKAETRRWLRLAEHSLAARGTLVLYGHTAPFTERDAAALEAWIRAGGHLVLRTADVEGVAFLAEELKLATHSLDDDCFEVTPRAQPDGKRIAYAPEPGPGRKAKDTPQLAFLCGDTASSPLAGIVQSGRAGEGHRFVRAPLGQGWVTLLPDLDFLGNSELEMPVARELAYQTLAPGLGRGPFVLIYGSDVPSLLRLLVEHGWPVLVPLTLALLAWLWARGQRFGPLLPLPPGNRRALLEHVQAAGEFAFRRGRGRALHTALRERFERRLQRRDPMLAALEGEARVQALSERFSLPAARVRQALDPRDLQRPEGFLHSMSTLALMRLRL